MKYEFDASLYPPVEIENNQCKETIEHLIKAELSEKQLMTPLVMSDGMKHIQQVGRGKRQGKNKTESSLPPVITPVAGVDDPTSCFTPEAQAILKMWRPIVLNKQSEYLNRIVETDGDILAHVEKFNELLQTQQENKTVPADLEIPQELPKHYEASEENAELHAAHMAWKQSILDRKESDKMMEQRVKDTHAVYKKLYDDNKNSKRREKKILKEMATAVDVPKKVPVKVETKPEQQSPGMPKKAPWELKKLEG